MAFYTGSGYWQDGVSIGPPAVGPLRAGAAGEFARWFFEAPERDDVCYFSIYIGQALVGQILLHDIDTSTGESLVGYHIFEPRQRGQGIGTKALTLLERFAAERTGLRRLVIITSRDNLASQALARKCGFVLTGVPREDPENGLVFEWTVPRARTNRGFRYET
jgi:RimJ/RimL family protein N-acetyltransferase